MRFANVAENNFCTEIFQVAKVIARRPRAVYELKHLNHTPLDGQFYRQELTPVSITDRNAYKIDEILDKIANEAFGNILSAAEIIVRPSTLGYLQLA